MVQNIDYNSLTGDRIKFGLNVNVHIMMVGEILISGGGNNNCWVCCQKIPIMNAIYR